MSDRNTRYKEKDKAAGISQLNLRVPDEHHDDFRLLAEFFRNNPGYRIRCVHNIKTGRMKAIDEG